MADALNDQGLVIGTPGCPKEGVDAGSAEDLQKAFVAGVIDSYARKAKRQQTRAKRSLSGGNRELALKVIDQALTNAANAFWWSEDTEFEEGQHQLLHEIGAWKYQHIGCRLDFDGEQYHQRCLVAIAHKRMGVSIGAFGDRICSLCDQDLSECPHRRDRSYWVRGGHSPEGFCRVCMEKSCAHRGDRLYRARVIARIRNSVLEEVSLVAKPAVPTARILDIPFGIDELTRELGSTIRPGMPLLCHACNGTCHGFTKFSPPV